MWKNRTNAMFVLLAAILLVIGTGLPVVRGDTEDTDVTVTVEGEDPDITIVDYTDPIDHNEDQVVDIEIETVSEDEAVNNVEVELTYDGDGAEGDATIYDSESKYDDSNWDGSGLYTDTFTFSDDLWRYSFDDDWSIVATAHSAPDFEDDTETATYDVNDYLNIEYAGDGTATGQPGQTLSGDDFEDPDEDGQPEMTVTANCEYELATPSFTLAHETEDQNTFGGDVESFSDPTFTPADSETFFINYEVEIPIGQEQATYATSNTGGSPATQSLTNAE